MHIKTRIAALVVVITAAVVPTAAEEETSTVRTTPVVPKRPSSWARGVARALWPPQRAERTSSTPAPTQSPTPRPSPRAEVRPQIQPGGSIPERIAAAWPGDDRWALRVTSCESVRYTDDYNESSGAAGWWQFMPTTWTRVLGQTGDPRDYSVEYQTKQAWRLFQMAGPSQWDCA